MAHSILPKGIIDQAILEDLASEIIIDSHPGILDRPRKFAAQTAATAAIIQPHLEALVHAYRQACETRSGGEAARRFLENMLSAEG